MSESNRSPEEMVDCVLDRFAALMKSLGRMQMKEWLAVDLTMSQMKVLFVLWDRGCASVGALASALGVSLPTMTGILDRLVEHSLVRRQPCPEDRRLVLNCLTDSGTELTGRLRQARRDLLVRIVRRLPEEDLSALAGCLDGLVRAAEEEW